MPKQLPLIFGKRERIMMDTLNQIFGISMTFGPAGLALTAAATTYSTSTAFNFANKGLVYAKARLPPPQRRPLTVAPVPRWPVSLLVNARYWCGAWMPAARSRCCRAALARCDADRQHHRCAAIPCCAGHADPVCVFDAPRSQHCCRHLDAWRFQLECDRYDQHAVQHRRAAGSPGYRVSGYSTSTKGSLRRAFLLEKNMASKQLPLATDDMATQRRQVRRIDGINTLNAMEAPDIQVVSIFDTSADYEAFMQQYVEIEIHTTQDKTRAAYGASRRQWRAGVATAWRACRGATLTSLSACCWSVAQFETVNNNDYAAEAAHRSAKPSAQISRSDQSRP